MTKTGPNYKNQRYAYNADKSVEYIGETSTPGADESENQWDITRILYDIDEDVIYRNGPLRGAWVDRETLGW